MSFRHETLPVVTVTDGELKTEHMTVVTVTNDDQWENEIKPVIIVMIIGLVLWFVFGISTGGVYLMG